MTGSSPEAVRRQNRYFRFALGVWVALLVCFVAVVGFVIHLLRDETRAADESVPNLDLVTTRRVWKSILDFRAAYGRLPLPPGAPEDKDRFLSELESMQVLRALAGGEPSINPRREVFLDLPLNGPDGRMLDSFQRQYAIKLDFNGDERLEHGGWSLETTAMVMSLGANGVVDREGTVLRDDVITPSIHTE